MSGTSILNTWLKKSDPVESVKKLFDIYSSFYKSSNKYADKIRKWWLENISYPIFRFKIHRIEIETSKLLFEHPDLLVFILTRFLISLQMYVDLCKNITIEDLINVLFPPNSITIKINRDMIDSKYIILGYSLIVRSYIVTDLDDIKTDKFAITTLDADIQRRDFIIAQTVYNTYDESRQSTAPIFYSKEFRLNSDGRLVNPNYILDHSLLEEDLLYYKLMISQIMVFIGGFFDEITKIYFINTTKNKN